MIGTNLSTRPFYNEQLVRWLLLAYAVGVAAVSVFHVATFVTLSRRDTDLGVRSSLAETKAAGARRLAEAVRARIDVAELKAVTGAAAEANRLIDRRTFSWTQLLAAFEATLPPEVRIVSVSPRVEKGGQMRIEMVVVARTAEDVDLFAAKLEARGELANVMLRQEVVNPEGLLETMLSGDYVGPGRRVHEKRGGS
jgi:Tfp pilus assembly protein PilN